MSCTVFTHSIKFEFDLEKIKEINASLIFSIRKLNKKLIDIKVFVKSRPCIP